MNGFRKDLRQAVEEFCENYTEDKSAQLRQDLVDRMNGGFERYDKLYDDMYKWRYRNERKGKGEENDEDEGDAQSA